MKPLFTTALVAFSMFNSLSAESKDAQLLQHRNTKTMKTWLKQNWKWLLKLFGGCAVALAIWLLALDYLFGGWIFPSY